MQLPTHVETFDVDFAGAVPAIAAAASMNPLQTVARSPIAPDQPCGAIV